MFPVVLLLCVLCVTVNTQETSVIVGNQTETPIPHNDIINTIENVTEYRDSIDNIRFACGLTVERYNETVDGDISKVNTKFRLATVCCPGYKRDHRGICQPYCKGGCGDGFCEFPEICTCLPNCAFNTVDRKCVCFEAKCAEACPRNASCVADNTCDCDQGFIKSNNWTKQYTNSSIECLPYCFPFCTNKLFTTPELCVCNYTAGGDNETFGNNSLESGFYNHQKSHTYLGHLFQSHGHPSFTSGLVGFGLGALVGGMIGSHGKSKYKYGKGGNGYGMPGSYGMGYPGYGNHGTPYGGGYGVPGNSHYGGYGNLGHTQTGHGYPGGVNYPQQGSYPGQGTNYGGNYPAQGTNYGGNYPGQGTNYGQGQSPNTNYGNVGQVPGQGSGGTYGAPGQNTGVHGAGQTHTQTNTGVYGAGVPGQTNTGVYGAGVPGQTNTNSNKGSVGQGTGTGTNIGWNTQGQGTSGNTGHNAGTGANNGWNSPPQGSQNIPKNTGTSGQSSYGWSVPGQANQGSSGGTNTGQRTNYGWSVPTNTNTGTGAGTGAGTGSSGKGSSSGTSWWPFGNSGKGNSGSGGGSSNSGSGSKGRKRGRKH